MTKRKADLPEIEIDAIDEMISLADEVSGGSTSYPGAIDSFTPKTDFVDDVMAAHVNNLQDAMVAVQTELGTTETGWTPTVTQGVLVAATVTLATYRIIRKLCRIEVILTITGTGTAGQPIVIGGQPAAIQPKNIFAALVPIGTGSVYDAGVGVYYGFIGPTAATTWYLTDPVTRGYIGQNPNMQLTDGDFVCLGGTYLVN